MNMDGTLTEEEQLISDSFRAYCEKAVRPAQEEWNRERKFPREIMKDISELVLPATVAGHDSRGPSESSIGLISELMGRYEFPVPGFLTMHFAKMLPLVADEEVREKYLGRYLKGDLVICGAFTEPGAGSDSAAISTSAVGRNGRFIVNGEKAFVSSPIMADAHIISLRTGEMDMERPHRGVSLLLVDVRTDGVEPYGMEHMATVFNGDFGGIRFNDAEVPCGNIIGSQGKGFVTLMEVLNTQRVHVALYSIGIAEQAIEEAIEYARIRKTFGQPISRHEAISFRLAESWTKLQASRLLAFRALALQENGKENSAECAAVKWYGCEAAFEAASNALQTLGASGYVTSSAMERRFRATRGFLIGDGTPDIQKMIISRRLFGREFSP